MKVKLKAWRRGGQNSFVVATDDGIKGFSKIGDCVEVSDAVAHKMVQDYPDMLELSKDAAPKAAKAKADKQVKTYSDKAAKADVVIKSKDL